MGGAYQAHAVPFAGNKHVWILQHSLLKRQLAAHAAFLSKQCHPTPFLPYLVRQLLDHLAALRRVHVCGHAQAVAPTTHSRCQQGLVLHLDRLTSQDQHRRQPMKLLLLCCVGLPIAAAAAAAFAVAKQGKQRQPPCPQLVATTMRQKNEC